MRNPFERERSSFSKNDFDLRKLVSRQTNILSQNFRTTFPYDTINRKIRKDEIENLALGTDLKNF